MDTRTASILATLAADGYADPEGEHLSERLPDGWSLVNLGFAADSQGYIHRGDPYLDLAAFVATNGSEIVIVFRGTDGVEDIVVDLTLPFLLPLLSNLFDDIVSAVKAYAIQHGLSLYTAGHSLGGAIAELITTGDASATIIGGLGIGSPGPVLFGTASDSSFLHVTRTQDVVGMIGFDEHLGVTTTIDDERDFGSGLSALLAAHNHDLYADQLARLDESPATSGMNLSADTQVLFLNGALHNTVSAAELSQFDAIMGGGGNDTFLGSSVSRSLRIEGGWGGDHIVGGTNWDALSGGHHNDEIQGGGGDDAIDGGAGNDVLVGGAGRDTYSIGVGDQTYIDMISDAGNAGEVDRINFYGGATVTSLDRFVFSVTQSGVLVVSVRNASNAEVARLEIVGMSSSASAVEFLELFAGAGENSVGVINLREEWEELHREDTPEEPEITGDSDAPAPSIPGSGFTYTGTSGANLFTGTSGNDVARGLDGVDALAGDAGNDTLLGNGDPDALNGGAGNDLLIDDDPGNLSVDNLAGGTGDDSLVFYGAPTGGADIGDGGSGEDVALIDLRSSNDDWRLNDGNGVTTVRPSDLDDGGTIELENVEIFAVLFGSGDDSASGDDGQFYFEGGDGNDHLSGGPEDDYLDGGDGNDQLDGDTGADWLDGGEGSDRAEMNLSSEARNVTYLADAARSATGFTFVNGLHIRNVERVELVTGSGDDQIWLGDFDETIETGSGDDVITTEGMGRDSVDGGVGEDRLVLDFSWSSTRVNSSSSGAGQVSFYDGFSAAQSVNRVSASNIEQFVVIGTTLNDNIRGNVGDDVLTGGSGDDNLRGAAGDDVLNGGSGEDLLDLGEGVDRADGGAGTDTLSLDRGDSSLDFTLDLAAIASTGGATLADGTFIRSVERLYAIEFGSGNDTVRTRLWGQADVNLRAGSDRLVVDHRGSSSALTSENSTLLGQSYLVFTGANFDGASDRILGRGIEAATIYGGSGDDIVASLAGNDAFAGGAGFDVFTLSIASTAATWERNGASGVWSVTGHGVDALTDVQVLRFSDRDVFLDGAVNDFSGDGGSDILLYRASDGVTAIWSMNGATVTNAALTSWQAGTDWDVEGVGDFNGDGRDDFLLRRDADGVTAIWNMNGATIDSADVTLWQADQTWTVCNTGDFDGDGRDDILWRRDSDGVLAIWTMDGFNVSSGAPTSQQAGLDWDVHGVGDFDGDGRDDLLVRNTDGVTGIWRMSGTTVIEANLTNQQAGNDWTFAGVGDFNGDGRDDFLLRHESGVTAIWTMQNGLTVASAAVTSEIADADWNVAQVGDYDGDGSDDILFVQDGTGTTTIWIMDGANVVSSDATTQQAGTEWGYI